MSQAIPQDAAPRCDSPRYQPLVIVLAAFSAGIVADRWSALAVGIWWTVAGAAWVAWLLFWRRGGVWTAAIALLIAVAACGGAWHHLRWHAFADDDLGYYAQLASQPVCVDALALTGPRRQMAPRPNPMRIIPAGDRTRVEVELLGLRDGPDWRTASGRARLIVDGNLQSVRAGDRLRIFALLSTPRPAQNPGEFDFALHARGDRRRSQLRAENGACVQVLRPAGWFSLPHWIENLRTRGDRLLWSYLDSRRAGLASAILLGAREEVAQEETEAFMATGTVHVLSISGMHVGIVAGAALLLMRLLSVPRTWSVVLVSLFTVFYTIVTDAEPPAVRAAILVLVASAAYYAGRRSLAFNSLAAAGLVVLAMNPADLFRTGVQLSFLCVAGLMWFAFSKARGSEQSQTLDALTRRNQAWPIRAMGVSFRWFWELTWLGAVLWILTSPLVMARFHLFSPVALVLNTILWLPMTLAMVAGFGVLLLGGLMPPLGALCGWCCDEMLWLLDVSIEAAQRVPASYFWVPGPADWWLWGFYGGIGLLAAFPAIRPPRRWCAAMAAGWLAIGFAAPWLCRETPHLECAFLCVDHGNATILALPSGATVLCDAGQFSSPEAGVQAISAYLWSRGIIRLDAVILSHPDADHYNAMPGLLERFTVGAIYVPPTMFDQSSPALLALQEAIQQARVPIHDADTGKRFDGGDGCVIEVRHPPRRGILGSDNANSLVLGIQYQDRRILLPGDLESPGLEDVTAEEPWHCDVLLAPHHGSRRSRPEKLAAWCNPNHVVISGGRRFGVEETKAVYTRSGSQVLHTADLGAIRATIDAAGVKIGPASGASEQ